MACHINNVVNRPLIRFSYQPSRSAGTRRLHVRHPSQPLARGMTTLLPLSLFMLLRLLVITLTLHSYLKPITRLGRSRYELWMSHAWGTCSCGTTERPESLRKRQRRLDEAHNRATAALEEVNSRVGQLCTNPAEALPLMQALVRARKHQLKVGFALNQLNLRMDGTQLAMS